MTTRNKSEYEIPTVIDFEFPNCLGLISQYDENNSRKRVTRKMFNLLGVHLMTRHQISDLYLPFKLN